MFVTEAGEFAEAVGGLLTRYPRPAVLAQLNLLDSHDTARCATITGGTDSLRLATLFQMTYPGAPCIYYGNEIGMTGEDDPDCRGAFPWDESRWDKDLHSWFKRCISLRKSHRSLRDGAWEVVRAKEGVLCYQRTRGEDAALVMVNNAPSPFTAGVPVKAPLQDGQRLVDALSGSAATIRNGALAGHRVPARGGAVFLRA